MVRFVRAFFAFLLRHPGMVVTLLLVALLAGSGLGAYWWHLHELQAARQALIEERYDDAHQHIESALSIWSRNAPAQLLAASIERHRGDLQSAEKHLNESKRLAGATSDEFQLEWMLLRAQAGEVDTVMPGLMRCVDDNHPESSQILETLAGVLLQAYRYPAALYVLDRWLDREPENVVALDWRGASWAGLRNTDAAMRDYERVLQLKPDRIVTRLRLVDLLLDNHHSDKALPYAEEAYRQKPDDPQVQVTLARCLIPQRRPEEGRVLLEKALATKPDDPAALLQLGIVENRAGQYDRAEGHLRQVLQTAPADLEALWAYYESLRRQGDRDKEADAALARHAEVKADLETIDDFMQSEGNKVTPDPRKAALVGAAFMRVGVEERGIHWLDYSQKKGAGTREGLRLLGAYYDKHGFADEAKAYYQQAQAAGPPLSAAIAVGSSAAATSWSR